MPVAAVRYASPASIPADLPRYAALCYPTGARVPGEIKRLECGLYLPSESVPADRRRVGIVQYLPGDAIPADMRRIIPVRSGSVAYSAAVLADSPVGYWRLGESSGPAAADASGNGNTGTYTGGVTLGQTGALAAEPDGTSNAAALFDGTSGYVTVPDHATLDTGDVFTLTAWVKRTANGVKCVLEKGANSYALLFSASNLLTLQKSGIVTIVAATVATTADGQYHHIAATKNGATVKLYVDGVDVTGTVTNATVESTATALSIGRHAANGQYFDGTIDEVAVCPTAFSAARIAAHYAAGTGR